MIILCIYMTDFHSDCFEDKYFDEWKSFLLKKWESEKKTNQNWLENQNRKKDNRIR